MYLNNSMLFQVPAPLCYRTRFKGFNGCDLIFEWIIHQRIICVFPESHSKWPCLRLSFESHPPLVACCFRALTAVQSTPLVSGCLKETDPKHTSWIPSWIKLKKYHIRRFVPCKQTHLLAEKPGPQAEIDVRSPSKKFLGRHPRTGAPEGTSAAGKYHENTSSFLTISLSWAPGTLALAFPHFLISLFIAWSQKIGLHSLLVQTCCLLSQTPTPSEDLT